MPDESSASFHLRNRLVLLRREDVPWTVARRRSVQSESRAEHARVWL